MAKIALCWELGGGSSHLAILAEYVDPLIKAGHQVCLITRNISTASTISEFKNIEIYQAPVLNNSLRSYDAANYSSILLMCGYDNQSGLLAVLQAWTNLLSAIEADYLIVEHSPTAVIAARLLDIPHAMTGQGFMVPPLEDPMPSMQLWKKSDPQKLAEADSKVLGFINKSVVEINSEIPPFPSVKSIFIEAQKWIMSYPELDHYGERQGLYYEREKNLYLNAEPIWPEIEGEKIFVYFDVNSPHLNNLLKQLAQLKQPVLAAIPGLHTNTIAQFDKTNVRIQTGMVNIKSVAEQCNLIISHAGHCTVADFLLMGIPSLLLPSTVERTMLAYRLGLSQLAFAGSPDTRGVDIPKMLKAVKTVDKVWENARIFADKYENSKQAGNLSDALKTTLV